MANAARQTNLEADTTPSCRPFLKWVGGKAQLLPELLARAPAFSGTYFEPFIGGGALLFGLKPHNAHISDINSELINCYQVVQSDLAKLLSDLKRHRYEEDYYYQVRDYDRSNSFSRWSKVRRASRLIFLNKTCYNGLYRVNSKGEFNVPFGRYTNPRIIDQENLKACSAFLKSVTIQRGSFLEVEHKAVPGDFVYFDPPYVPLSRTSDFTGYSSDGFDVAMQRELFELCCRLDRKGVQFMLSNSSAPFVLDLYPKFRLELVSASRAINSKGNKRGKISEVIVRNY